MKNIGYARACKVISDNGGRLVRSFDGYKEYQLPAGALAPIAMILTDDPTRKNPRRAYNCHWEPNRRTGGHFFSIQKSY